MELLFLLLPLAAASGWYLGSRSQQSRLDKSAQQLSHNYYTGLNYLLNEQPDKAVDAFLQVLDVNDDMVETHLTLGNLFRRQGQVDRAIRIHNGLLARPKLSRMQRATSMLELARDYVCAGVYDRAEKILQELIYHNDHVEASLQQLLAIYQQAKDWLRAVETTQKLQRIIGKDLSSLIAQFYCELAEKAWRDAEVKTAKKMLKAALAVNKACGRAYIISGKLAQQAGKYKQAIHAYKQVIEHNAEYNAVVLPEIANCYLKLANMQDMIQYLEQIIIAKPGVGAVLELVDSLEKTRGVPAAIAYLGDYLKQHPSFVGLSKLVKLYMLSASGKIKQDLQTVQQLIDKMLANKAKYKCNNCGFTVNNLEWHCPGCKQWETLKPT